MKLIERYIFARLFNAWLVALITLTAIIWMTQALNRVNLVTAQGQTLWLFLKLTLLLVPEIATLLVPAALLVAVTYTFSTLNSDSELVVINASGAPQSVLLKPAFLVGAIAAAVIAAMTLYFAPLAQRAFRSELAAVYTNIVTSMMNPGQFMNITDGLVFHLRDRRPDDTLQGLFLSDTRDPDSTTTYLAETGTVLQSGIGTFLIMNNGSIQRRTRADGTLSMIEFTSYAFDLSAFTNPTGTLAFRPQEQPTSYLLNPDPQDRFYQRSPRLFAAELHKRLSTPLYAFVCMLIPLMFLVQAETTRKRQTLTLAIAVLAAIVLRGLGSFLTSAAPASLLSAGLTYAVPVGASLVAAVLILTGIQPKVPKRFSEFIDSLTDRVGARFNRSTRIGNAGP
jgi:lipopolysaccharide export system permease protein